MKGINSQPLDGSGLRIAIVASRWNDFVGEKILDGARKALLTSGVLESDIKTVHVPGAFELPLAAKRLAASGNFDAVVTLGTVIRGDTPHFDFVAGAAAHGVMAASLETGVPITFGVITADNDRQALDRAGGPAGNKGTEAAEAAIEMALALIDIGGD